MPSFQITLNKLVSEEENPRLRNRKIIIEMRKGELLREFPVFEDLVAAHNRTFMVYARRMNHTPEEIAEETARMELDLRRQRWGEYWRGFR